MRCVCVVFSVRFYSDGIRSFLLGYGVEKERMLRVDVGFDGEGEGCSCY